MAVALRKRWPKKRDWRRMGTIRGRRHLKPPYSLFNYWGPPEGSQYREYSFTLRASHLQPPRLVNMPG